MIVPAARELLAAVVAENGQSAGRWGDALLAVPRHAFLPDTIWSADGHGTYTALDAHAEPDAWLATAYANAPVITQVNDGRTAGPDAPVLPSSSASSPAIVIRMLSMLDPQPGQRVLEIGTGTGWNAALLAHVLGAGSVTTVEVDRELARRAAVALDGAACVVTGDGAQGWAPGAPYDRVLATCAVSTVPSEWIRQTRPDGTVLTPWSSPWCDYGLLHLTVHDDGTAQGRFSPHSAFMLMRGQRRNLRVFRDVVHDDHRPEESCTALSPWTVADDDWDLQFALGLRCPDLWYAWHDAPAVDGVATRLWIATTDATAWAAVDYDGQRKDRFTVWQHGTRRLWDEVEAAHDWYVRHDRPTPGRFGLTIHPAGQRTWLNDPACPVTR
ncbi:methyltransferase [Streptoverticillium reticulum]|uniref:methyltransferase n=1 Tax=Streptoverticillium reticulum TaxID=1433415 RepID=UPI0039BF5B51